MSARGRRDWYRVEDAIQMINDLDRKPFVFVPVEVAQEYLLCHMFDPAAPVMFKSVGVPGVLMASKQATEADYTINWNDGE